jgi:hypothetical protein
MILRAYGIGLLFETSTAKEGKNRAERTPGGIKKFQSIYLKKI